MALEFRGVGGGEDVLLGKVRGTVLNVKSE